MVNTRETAISNKKFNIREVERAVVGSVGVLVRAEKEEEADATHVGDALAAGVGRDEQSNNHLYRDWFDSTWRRIVFSVGAHLTRYSKVELSVGVKSDIWGPHTTVRRNDGTKGVRKCARSNGVAAGCGAAP